MSLLVAIILEKLRPLAQNDRALWDDQPVCTARRGMEIQNRVALVTGAGRRLGKAIAIELGRRGACVGVHYNSSMEGAQKTVEQIRSFGVKAVAVRADQESRDEIFDAVRSVEETLGPVDVLVNSAAIFHRQPFPETDLELWDQHLNTNLRGPWLFACAVAPGMRQRGAGKIVNILDLAVERPWPGYLPYTAAKAGLAALTRGLARTLAPQIQVNGIAPGIILPPEEWSEEELDRALARVPMRRTGTPEEIADTVLFLVNGPDYITGAIIPVDGGQSVV